MLFNSLQFLGFFPCICLLYWALDYLLPKRWKLGGCNALLLIGSYYFYMCWQPKYALLLLLSTAVTYTAALLIEHCNSTKGRKWWLTAAIVSNIAILFFYKYYGFVAGTITDLLSVAGLAIDIPHLDVLLPVGISFYIFQALGYSIDVYRGEIKAERNFFTYALFVSFFPQLVAGPIERSTNLLKQFKERHRFDYDFAFSGFKLMLWGYLLKLCMADRASMYVDAVFNNLADHGGCNTLMATILFSIQIYGDFAGYTFIAIGCGRIMGFALNDNFRRPYLAVSITDFWRRWHISLSTWLRDYIYFPLGGSRTTRGKTYRNLLVTFGLSGLWHGANWTFVVWGLVHGVVQCIERLLGINKKVWHGWQKFVHMCATLFIVNFAWMLFRADSICDAWTALKWIFTPSDYSFTEGNSTVLLVGAFTSIVLLKELMEEGYLRRPAIANRSLTRNYLWPIFLLLCICILGAFEGGQFIYFQF